MVLTLNYSRLGMGKAMENWFSITQDERITWWKGFCPSPATRLMSLGKRRSACRLGGGISKQEDFCRFELCLTTIVYVMNIMYIEFTHRWHSNVCIHQHPQRSGSLLVTPKEGRELNICFHYSVQYFPSNMWSEYWQYTYNYVLKSIFQFSIQTRWFIQKVTHFLSWLGW